MAEEEGGQHVSAPFPPVTFVDKLHSQLRAEINTNRDLKLDQSLLVDGQWWFLINLNRPKPTLPPGSTVLFQPR